MNIEQRQGIERRLVRHLCATMRKHGWIPYKVDDGEEYVKCETDDDVLDVVFSVDESSIRFKRDDGVRHGVLIVLGNDGWDAIADYGYSETDDFRSIMEEEVDPFANELEERGLAAVSPLERAAGAHSVVSRLAGQHEVWFAPTDENETDVMIATFINLDDARLFASLKNGG